MEKKVLINKSATVEQLRIIEQNDKITDRQKFAQAKFVIENAPDAQKRGRWEYEDTIGGMRHYYCTNCEKGGECIADENEIKWFNFCPKCGARMDATDTNVGGKRRRAGMMLLIAVFCAGCCVGAAIGIGDRLIGSRDRRTLDLSKQDMNTLQTGLLALYKGFEYDAHNSDNSEGERKLAMKSADMWKDLHAKVKEQTDRQGGVV